MWSDYGTIIQRCTHEPHFCACFLLAKDRRKKKLSRLPVLRREAIAFEVCIREGEDETIVRNTSLQDLRSQHNSPPKSCSGCKSLDVFCPQGPELKWFIRRAPPLSLDRSIAVCAMYLQSLSTTGGWNRASWKRFLIEPRKMFKTTT